MRFVYKSTNSRLVSKIEKQRRDVPRKGRLWAIAMAQECDRQVRHNLETQGRGGQPPPLSSATLQIYANSGQPNGDGIENHLTLDYRQRGDRFIAILGIPDGQPTVVAKVQDRGATIPVTDKMRGFLAANGIFLRQETTHIVVPGRRFWAIALRNTRKLAWRKARRIRQ